ncbi:unnamed protein product [Closterium sp. NIES-54]
MRGHARLGSAGGSRRLVCRNALLEDESDGESTRESPALKKAVPGAKPGSSKSWQETTASAAAVAALLDSAAGGSEAEKASTAFASSAAATGGSATAGAAGGAATGGATAAGPAAAAVGEFCIIEGPDALQDFARMQLTEIRDNITSRRNRIFLLLEEVRHRGKARWNRHAAAAAAAAASGGICSHAADGNPRQHHLPPQPHLLASGRGEAEGKGRGGEEETTCCLPLLTTSLPGRNRIFLLLEEIRRLRIQQEIKNAEESRNRAAAAAARAKLGGLPGEEEEEMPEYPSSIPFLPPLKTDTLKEYYITFAFLVASLIIFGGLVAPTLQLRLGMGGTSYEDFIASMHLPRQLRGGGGRAISAAGGGGDASTAINGAFFVPLIPPPPNLPSHYSQVDPIAASFTGGAVGVLSALLVVEVVRLPLLLMVVSLPVLSISPFIPPHATVPAHRSQVDPIAASFTGGAVGMLSALLLVEVVRLPLLLMVVSLPVLSISPFIPPHATVPAHRSQVDPIVASFTGGAVGVLSALLVVEVNNVKQQEHKRCMYCHGSGYLACARCAATGSLIDVQLDGEGSAEGGAAASAGGGAASNGALAAAAGAGGAVTTAGRQGMKVAKRCPNCAGLRKVMCPTCLCTGMALATEHDPRINPFE